MDKTYTINISCANDKDDSYEEEGVPISDHCELFGTRCVSITKAYTHKVYLSQDAVITVVQGNNGWHMVDKNGNYDDEWYITSEITLENVKFQQGLVIRGTLKNADYSYNSNNKYCKKLKVNHEKFFTHKNIPVMKAEYVLINRGYVHGRGIK